MQRLDTYENQYEGPENQQEVLQVGTITGVNMYSYTCDVILKNGQSLIGVAIAGVTGTAYSEKFNWKGDLDGASVLLAFVLGKYFIITILPTQVDREENEGVRPVLPTTDLTALEELNKKSSFSNFNRQNPTDILPSDIVHRNADGAELSLFRGSLVRLKASNLAQIMLGKFKDWCRIVARNVDIFTDFGELKFYHEDGKVAISVFGGALYDEETNHTKKKWTFTAHIGHHEEDEDHRMYIKTNDKDGDNIVTISADIKGDLKTFTDHDHKHKAKNDIISIAKNDINSHAHNDIISLAENIQDHKANASANYEAVQEVTLSSTSSKIDITAMGNVNVKGSIINLN